MQVLFGNTVE